MPSRASHILQDDLPRPLNVALPDRTSPPSVQYGEGTLRLTTRQCYQLHGVLKHDLKTVFSSVIKAMGSTLGACGDVNRNVLAPPVQPAPYLVLPLDMGY